MLRIPSFIPNSLALAIATLSFAAVAQEGAVEEMIVTGVVGKDGRTSEPKELRLGEKFFDGLMVVAEL